MRRFWLSLVAAGAFAGAFMVPASAQAQRQRSPAEVMRYQLVRTHVRLMREALQSPEIELTRQAAAEAYANLYQIRENILIKVRQQPEYADLKLALWHQQRLLEGLHDEIPQRVQKIMANATSTLAIRGQISKFEVDALEASDDYLMARDDMNSKTTAYQRTVRDAMDRVRVEPEFVSMREQFLSASQSVAKSLRGRAVVYR